MTLGNMRANGVRSLGLTAAEPRGAVAWANAASKTGRVLTRLARSFYSHMGKADDLRLSVMMGLCKGLSLVRGMSGANR
jgi:hypothetical protein